MDIQKAFDLFDHTFVFSVLKKKTGFGNNFVSRIEILLLKQTFSAIICGNTAQ